jgi:hypothetical protein
MDGLLTEAYCGQVWGALSSMVLLLNSGLKVLRQSTSIVHLLNHSMWTHLSICFLDMLTLEILNSDVHLSVLERSVI